jgi:hypothetical protein
MLWPPFLHFHGCIFERSCGLYQPITLSVFTNWISHFPHHGLECKCIKWNVCTLYIVGELRKTFHTRNVGVAEFVNMFLNMSRGLSWQESVLEGALSSFNFADPLTTCKTNCRNGIKIAGLFPISGRESGEFRKSWTCEFRTFGIWWIQEVMNLKTSDVSNLVNSRSHGFANFRRFKESQLRSLGRDDLHE